MKDYEKYGVIQRITFDDVIIDFNNSNFIRIGYKKNEENGCLTSFRVYSLDTKVNNITRHLVG